MLNFPSLGEGFSIPLKISPASAEEKVELRTICREHGSPVEQVFQCQENGEPVEMDRRGKAKIYPGQSGREHLIPVSDEELASLKEQGLPQSITITSAVSVHDFDASSVVSAYRVWTDKPYERMYASLFRAMDRTQSVGMGSIVINSKEGSNVYRAALRASGRKEFTVFRLRYLSEMREGVQITEEKADPLEVKVFTNALLELRRIPEEVLINSYNKKLNELLVKKEMDFFKKVAQSA